MRELAENTIAAADTTAIRVTGSSEKTRLPYRVEPADDADLLYVNLVTFGQWVAERIGGSSPRALREHLWRGPTEPQGLPVCTPHEAFALAAEITRWLTASTHHIAHDPELHDAPDALVETIRDMHRAYPRSEPQFRAYRPRPCVCGAHTIRPLWDSNGLAGAICDTCQRRWEKKPE